MEEEQVETEVCVIKLKFLKKKTYVIHQKIH